MEPCTPAAWPACVRTDARGRVYLVASEFAEFEIECLVFPFPYEAHAIRDEIAAARPQVDDKLAAFVAPCVPVRTSVLTLLLNAERDTRSASGGERASSTCRASHDVMADMQVLIYVLERKADVSTPERKTAVLANVAKRVREYGSKFDAALRACAPRSIAILQSGDSLCSEPRGARETLGRDPAEQAILESELAAALECARLHTLERLRLYESAVAALLGVPPERRAGVVTQARPPGPGPDLDAALERCQSENARLMQKRLVLARTLRTKQMPTGPVSDDEALRTIGCVPRRPLLAIETAGSGGAVPTPGSTRRYDGVAARCVVEMLHYMFYEPRYA